MTQYSFSGICCVNAQAQDIEEMVDNAAEVEYKTMRDHCSDLLEWAKEVGYGPWLALKDDWHARFNKSTYKGEPCYFVVHSAIEYIWLPVDN